MEVLELNRKERYAVLMIGLDDFQNIERSQGRAFAEELAERIRQRISRLLRAGDVLEQAQANVVAAVLPMPGVESALRIAGRLRDSLIQPLSVDGRMAWTGVSIGVASFPEDGDRFETVTQRARIGLKRAQEAGGNRVEHFDREIAARMERRSDVIAGLWRAYEHEDFAVVFQPIVDARTREIRAVEALLRLADRSLGALSPGEFVPLLEQSGLIMPVGEWTLRRACTEMLQLRRDGHDEIGLNVNVSPQQFEQSDFVERVRAILKATQFPPSQLVLEITESLLIKDPEMVGRKMQQLRNLDVKLTLDDFGTGHASIGYLQRLPLSGLKIDQSYIAGLPHNERSMALTQTLVQLGETLHLRVTAEGVEREEQVDVLQGLGVERLQGFLFGRGMPADALAAHLMSAGSLPKQSAGQTRPRATHH